MNTVKIVRTGNSFLKEKVRLKSFVRGYLKSEIKATPQFPITLPIMTGNLLVKDI